MHMTATLQLEKRVVVSNAKGLLNHTYLTTVDTVTKLAIVKVSIVVYLHVNTLV